MNSQPEESGCRLRRRGANRLWSMVAVCAVGGLCGCQGPPAASEQAEVEPQPLHVTVAPVTPRAVQRRVEAVGTLHGFEEVAISAAVGGRVRRIAHDVADRVQPGDLLLEIDPTDYELAVRQAEKGLQVELARLGLAALPSSDFELTSLPAVVQARLRLEQAQQRFDRASRLAGGAAIAEETLEDYRTAFHLAEAEYQNQLNQTRAELATIQLRQQTWAIAEQQLQDTKIAVPIPTGLVPESKRPPESDAAGTVANVLYAITSRSAAEGAFVRPGDELFRLVIEDPLKLRVRVAERFVADVAVEQAVEISVPAYRDKFQGTVHRINPAVDPASRTFEVEILVPNPDYRLKPGGFAKADILTRVDPNAVTVPLEAVVSFAGIDKVFLVDEQQRAAQVTVALGIQGTEWVELVGSDLAPGVRVITTGQAALVQGSPIVIRDRAGQEASETPLTSPPTSPANSSAGEATP